MTLQNEKFEELIADHVNAALEPQRGKALATFRAHIAAHGVEEAPAPIPFSAGLRREVSRRAAWAWTGVPSLVAAGLAIVVMLQLGTGGGQNHQVVKRNDPGSNVVASSVEVTQSHTGGVVVSDDKPMREVRQEKVIQHQWVDPKDGAVYTVTEPSESFNYIQVQPN